MSQPILVLGICNPQQFGCQIAPHFMGNDKGLYATMIGGRIDPSSCLDTCWVDDMAVWWFRATCFHGLKYLCVNREVLKTKSL